MVIAVYNTVVISFHEFGSGTYCGLCPDALHRDLEIFTYRSKSAAGENFGKSTVVYQPVPGLVTFPET